MTNKRSLITFQSPHEGGYHKGMVVFNHISRWHFNVENLIKHQCSIN